MDKALTAPVEIDTKSEVALPVKQRKFLKYYLDTGNATYAAKKAGYKYTPTAYEILNSPKFKYIFKQLLDKKGLTDYKIINKLIELLEAKKIISANVVHGEAGVKTNEFVEVPDNQTRVKALELLVKLRLPGTDIDKINIPPDATNIIIINPQQREREQNGPTIHINAETGPGVQLPD